MSARLDIVADRIARIRKGPDAIEAHLLFRLGRPVLAIAGWRARLHASSLGVLVALLRRSAEGDAAKIGIDEATAALDAATEELEANVDALERVTIVRRTAPYAHCLWLSRVHGVLLLARAVLELGDETLLRPASEIDASAIFPPLVRVRGTSGALDIAAGDDEERLVDLELAAIDHLMAAARAETALLGRRRRLLVAARQRLLEVSAALPLAREGVRQRTHYLARAITKIDRLEAAGLDAEVSLVHQARQALTRRDPRRLFAALSALDEGALAGGDHALSRRTGRMLERLSGGETDNAASIERSAIELLGEAALCVRGAVQDARGDALHRMAIGGTPSERKAAGEFLEYLPQDSDREIVRAALAADGFFEVGGALTPVRITEEEHVLRVVRHPTQDLVLKTAEDVSDLRDAVIGDPRSILLDLATGRLFARRFVREDVRSRSRTVMRSEVRVYVLDGSGSMKGPRARVRDAILVAELSTLMGRLRDPGSTRSTLYYRYFDEALGPVSRVDTIQAAKEAIRDCVMHERAGGTDIQAALLASLEQIAEARRHDPVLARGQIVLVTDGEAPVDEGVLVAAREAIFGLPIGVSVIALGQENPALAGIVARQRAKGEAAFYHFLDDEELLEITRGELDRAIHPPARWAELEADPEALAAALDGEIAGLLDELDAIDRQRDLAALERLEEEAQARREVGLEHEHDDRDGERARFEALRKDRVALSARYARWFPEPTEAEGACVVPAAKAGDVDAACCALASVAEVVTLLGGSPLARQADAIDLFERILPDAGLTPLRYRAVLHECPGAVGPSLRALREAVRGPAA